MPRTSRSVPDIVEEKSPKWREVPRPSEDVLRNRMVQMYWFGVSREVVLLIRTLRSWQHRRYANVDDVDEVLRPEDMKGFNAFVERAVGRGRCKRVQAEIRESIRNMERNARVLSKDQRRAQMLLQGAGFLDITKLMEHREPPGKGFWSRPRAAQRMSLNHNNLSSESAQASTCLLAYGIAVSLDRYDRTSHMPYFRPLVCTHCLSTIRGTHFRCLKASCQFSRNPPPDGPLVYCETCMRTGKYCNGHLRKLEKRCILREVVSPKRSGQICTCENGRRSESNEDDSESESECVVNGGDLYFAVSGERQHFNNCPILKLKRQYERARFNELRHNTEFTTRDKGRRTERLRLPQRNSQRDDQVGRSQSESVYIRNQAVSRAAELVPPPIEFGNVHMMLMAGTIIIEIGYPESKAGALISIREPPQFTIETAERQGGEPMMCISPTRRIFQRFGILDKRRIRACMKQVVGGVFATLSNDHKWCESEWDIINSLVDASRRCAVDPMKSQAFQNKRLSAAAERIVDKLRVLIGDRVTRYFDVLARNLFTVELEYNRITNHCQRFCANILDFRVFGSFLATTPACRIHVPKNPLYLVSFVCPPGSYDTPRPIRPKTKTRAPNGLTEEYILRFRQYGNHEESDIADKLMEYWRDWGNFGGPLYRHQGLFPWDCTEAYRRNDAGAEGKCNNCSIAKHVWSFPFDAWSMVQLHIQKERQLYPPTIRGEKALSPSEWMRNRLAVLSALGALNTIAVAMARTTSFRATCRWNRERNALTPDIASRLDRLKLSGIHRAQPRSHFFEQSKYHDCTIAEWALLSREDQIKEYEMIRDRRADVLEEIPRRPSPSRPRIRLPHSSSSGRNNNADIGVREGDSQRDGHLHESFDSASDEPTDIDEEEYEEYIEKDVEEADFEAGGGLLPVSIGADPPSDNDANTYHSHDDYADAVDSSLLPNGVDPEADRHTYRGDHDQGAGLCDYDEDNGWIDDLPTHAFEECRRSADDAFAEFYQQDGRRSSRWRGDDNDECPDDEDDISAGTPPYNRDDDDPGDDYTAAGTSDNFDPGLDNPYVDEYYPVDDGGFADFDYFSPPDVSYDLGLDSNFNLSSFDTGYLQDPDFSSICDPFDTSF